MRPVTLLFALLISLCCMSLSAQDLSGFEKILLPLEPGIIVTGANGTTFGTAMQIHAARDVRIYPTAQGIGIRRPHDFLLDFAFDRTNRGGRILYAEKSGAENLFVQMSVASSAADAPAYLQHVEGLPTARERDFRTGLTSFPSVPFPYVYLNQNAGARMPYLQYRYALRLYDVDLRGNVALRIRIYDTRFGPTPQLRANTVVHLDRRDGSDPSYPYYTNVDLDSLFSSCTPFSLHTPCAGSMTRVEIEPLEPGVRYWALLSLTNNFTQEMTLYTP